MRFPVGSLQKPFVAKAWASTHAGQPPTATCTPASRCWLPQGHGTLSLARALSVSCNAYFRMLAEETPLATLQATLQAEGFLIATPLTPETAIGFGAPNDVSILPGDLLSAYVRLTREPWVVGEATRALVLRGLRAAALGGTANGLAHRGLYAKTGTVAALAGPPTSTSGWAIAIDDSGWAALALAPHGTGRSAAEQLASRIDALRPWQSRRSTVAAVVPVVPQVDNADPHATLLVPTSPARDAALVVVRLFESLRPRAVVATNADGRALGTTRGFVGPGGAHTLHAGEALESGLWDLELPEFDLVRRLNGALRVQMGRAAALRVTATLTLREYVLGVVSAELPRDQSSRRLELAAAVVRFVRAGPRHSDADVCDTTHCAWFVVRGPRVRWDEPGRAHAVSTGDGDESGWLSDSAWDQVLGAAQRSGPDRWTAHCGGAPLAPHTLWGNGDRSITPCTRHGAASARHWTRFWSDAAVERAFGRPEPRLDVTLVNGVWRLRVGETGRLLLWDEAHRLIARELGWGALPSPAAHIERVAGGYRLAGVGLGHRVGLCLAP
jgi:hypothetical protein